MLLDNCQPVLEILWEICVFIAAKVANKCDFENVL